MGFSPFPETAATPPEASDLSTLLDVAEGWFVEYKREPVSAKQYAKEICAFANTRGGWLFVGIDEDGTTGKAESFPGVPSDQARAVADQIRDAIAAHVRPKPDFELSFIAGQAGSALDADRTVVVVHVPESFACPHIHSSGKIYRRNADAAEPRAESDPHILHQLNQKARSARGRISEALDDAFDETWCDTSRASWISVGLVVDPQTYNKEASGSFEKLVELAQHESRGAVFSDVTSNARGLLASMARHQQNGLGPFPSIEFAYSQDVFVNWPLSTADADLEDDILCAFSTSDLSMEFGQLLRARNISRPTLINGTDLTTAIFGAFDFISVAAREFGLTGRYFWRLRGHEVFRRVPYFESRTFVDRCRRNGVPVLHRSSFVAPSRDGWFVAESLLTPDIGTAVLSEALAALGVVDDDLPTVSGEIAEYVAEQQKKKGPT